MTRKKTRQFNLDTATVAKRIPEKFQTSGILNSIDKPRDLEYLVLLIRTAKKLNLDISETEIQDETKDFSNMESIWAWFEKKLLTLPFPSPPWKGNRSIKPLTTFQKLTEAGERFDSHIDCFYLKVLTGHCYFYICEQTPAKIEIHQDVFLGWYLGFMEKPAHKELTRAEKITIFEAFAEFGIHKYPRNVTRLSQSFAASALDFDVYKTLHPR